MFEEMILRHSIFLKSAYRIFVPGRTIRRVFVSFPEAFLRGKKEFLNGAKVAISCWVVSLEFFSVFDLNQCLFSITKLYQKLRLYD